MPRRSRRSPPSAHIEPMDTPPISPMLLAQPVAVSPPPPELATPAIVISTGSTPAWLQDIETQLKCSMCLEVAACGYVRLSCDCYYCAECIQSMTKYRLEILTHYMDQAFTVVRFEPFPCPKCRTPSDLEPNLLAGNRRCDANFLCLRQIYQAVRPNTEYLACSCPAQRHDNDNTWIQCASRSTPCSWCQQQIRLSEDPLNRVYTHLTQECTHKFECRYCSLVENNAWRQLSYTYPNLLTHCKVHRLSATLLYRTRELMGALYQDPLQFNSDTMQFWVQHLFSLMRVIEIESRQTMFSDDPSLSSSSFRSATIRRRISNLIGQATPNPHTREVAPSLHELLMNSKWVQQDRPPNVMEVLPALIRIIYQDQEPSAITDITFLQSFVTESGGSSGTASPPPPETNGARLLAAIMDLNPPFPPPPPPPPIGSMSPPIPVIANQYNVLRRRPGVIGVPSPPSDSDDDSFPPLPLMLLPPLPVEPVTPPISHRSALLTRLGTERAIRLAQATLDQASATFDRRDMAVPEQAEEEDEDFADFADFAAEFSSSREQV